MAGAGRESAVLPGTLQSLIAARVLADAPPVDLSSVTLLPLVAHPEKIICVGLNYTDHSAESGFEQPEFPTLFGRFNSSLIGHGAPIVRPDLSKQLDNEGELVAVIGSEARNVSDQRGIGRHQSVP